MKFKNKGRKIYKTKEKNYYGKTPLGKAVSVGLSILLIGGIGFIGYSLAEPIVNYTKKKGDDKSSVTTEAETSETERTSERIQYPTGSGGSLNIHQSVNFETYRAAALKETDMMSKEAIELALNRLPSGQNIDYVEVPLKVSGGKVYYSTKVYYALGAVAAEGMPTLDEIVETVESAGYKPVAVVSTFNDNLLPLVDRDCGYITANSGEQWIDDDYEAGGKPWTTPFSQTSVDYLDGIVEEAAEAGFEKIVCSDFVFPHFRDSDYEMLDEQLSLSSRSMAMTAAANQLNSTILSNGSSMFIEVSASELLRGYTDILQPMLLNVNTIVLNIDLDEISNGVKASDTVYEFSGSAAEKAEKMLHFIEGNFSDFNVAVRLSGSTATMTELLEAKDKLADMGYTSFVIG